jgi:hypothetical protein
MTTATHPPRLADLPLWRLIVLLDDAERTLGPTSETARTVARIIRDRVGSEGHDITARPAAAAPQEVVSAAR